jgi:inosine-uridine nucleoside N-ribohydrolase
MKRLLTALLLAAVASGQIHVDTDSGYFTDDGVALTMLLRSPRRADVKGISVVSGNVWALEGAEFMSRNVRLLGLPDMPVLIGAEAPLIHTPEMAKREEPLEYTGAFATPVPTMNPLRGGIDLLIRNIDAAPGKLTILAIGPLTNLAIALRLRPDIEKKIAAVIIMGGAIRVPGNASKAAEFNFWFDPEAAQIVLRSAIAKKVLLPLDASIQTLYGKKFFDEIIAVKTPITALYRQDFGNRFPGFFLRPSVRTMLWDELAAAYLIDPALVTRKETLYLDVDTVFGKTYGAVKTLDRRIVPNSTSVEVVFNMDFPKVFDLYRRALTVK